MQQNSVKDSSSVIDVPISNKKNKRRSRYIITYCITAANIIIISLIFVFGFSYLLFFERETVSHEENRNLTEFPEFTFSAYFSGEYTAGIADYYDDTVHNRSEIKKFISSYLLPLKGRQYGDDGLVIYNNGSEEHIDEPQPEPAVTTSADDKKTTDTSASQNSVTETTTTAAAVPDNKNPAADGEIANNIVVVNNRGLMLYGGGTESGKEYASFVNAYKKALGDSVNVYSMLCPTAVSYYMPENYLNLTASEEENINLINSALVDVTPVDAFNALLKHKSEAIYSRTDHHWQPLGAYYAAEVFAEAAGVPFAALSEYETVTVPGYVGTLYGYTKSASLINNPEDFIYYKPKANTVTTRYSTAFTEPRSDSLLLDHKPMSNSSYYMVFGGDGQITHVATECRNGRNLVIFKDSYGNALLPVLTSSFENIYLCDIRYFDLNAVQFVKDTEATDLLFAMTAFSATGSNRKYIQENLNK